MGNVNGSLFLTRLEAATAEACIAALSRALHAAGHVEETFEAAAIARERRSPTGLPFPGIAVALPHAEPEHVRAPAIAVATLAAPVTFRQMGAPAQKLAVRVVVMPALTAKEQAAGGLAEIIARLREASFREALVAASTPEELRAIVEEKR